MNLQEEFCLLEYQDLGPLDGQDHIRIARNKYNGTICLKKHVPIAKLEIYRQLKELKVKGIPKIFACIEDNDELIVIEKYIEGETLESKVKGKVISEEEAIHLLLNICETLRILHHGDTPVICRDLKADNIIIDAEERPWIVDFDIARVFHKGQKRDTQLLGTAEYAAPEQYGFFQTDCRTDIYSLGVLMNYMVTGKFPVESMAKGKLQPLIEKCTYLDPDKRYQDVESLITDLRKAGGNDVREGSLETRSWVLPGFRSGKISHSLLALAGYVLLTYFAFSMEMRTGEVVFTGIRLRIEQMIFWSAEMMSVLVLFNYRGWREGMPLLRSNNPVLKFIGGIVALVIIFFTAICLCAFVETFFF